MHTMMKIIAALVVALGIVASTLVGLGRTMGSAAPAGRVDKPAARVDKPAARVEKPAAQALIKLIKEGKDTDGVVPALLGLLRGNDPKVRAKAADTLRALCTAEDPDNSMLERAREAALSWAEKKKYPAEKIKEIEKGRPLSVEQMSLDSDEDGEKSNKARQYVWVENGKAPGWHVTVLVRTYESGRWETITAGEFNQGKASAPDK